MGFFGRALGSGFFKKSSAGGGGGVSVTWNSSDMAANGSLSNDDLVFSLTSTSNGSVRADLGRSSGKYYFEVLYEHGGTNYSASVGVLESTHSLTTYIGDNADGYGYMNNGRYYIEGSVTTSKPTWNTSGNIVMVAVDMDNNKIWFGLNDVWDGDPAAGTGEAGALDAGDTMYPAASLYTTDRTLTGRFATIHQTYTAPTGFSAWDS